MSAVPAFLLAFVVDLERESNLKVVGLRHGEGEEQCQAAALLNNEFNAASLADLR